MTDDDPLITAALLVDAVQNALARGVLHRDRDGKSLRTAEAVLEALARDGEITIYDPISENARELEGGG